MSFKIHPLLWKCECGALVSRNLACPYCGTRQPSTVAVKR